MRLDNISEDLDDRDEFGQQCGYCIEYGSTVNDQQRFHEKHEQAEIMAERAANTIQDGWSARREKYSDIFNIEMWRFGYIRQDSRGPWIDKPHTTNPDSVQVKEDLDDKDEFEFDVCGVCNQNCDLHGRIPGPDFHQAHTAASEDAKTVRYTGLPFAQAIRDVYEKTMESYGYSKHFTVKSGERWIKRIVKEDLDDKDEFNRECGYCEEYASEVIDKQRFHIKHGQAEDVAERAMHEVPTGWRSSAGRKKYSEIFNVMLRQSGYVRHDSRGPWFDAPLKEDLDDKDEFTRRRCYVCGGNAELNPTLDLVDFHVAHEEAETYIKPYFDEVTQSNWDDFRPFEQEMAKRGYILKKTNIRHPDTGKLSLAWFKDESLRDDLDDKDEFRLSYCDQCYWYAREIAPGIPPNDYHQAHLAAGDAIVGPNQTWEDAYAAEMKKFGYIPTQNAWIKEDLDDKDEFKQDCIVCGINSELNPELDTRDFHTAHIASRNSTGMAWSNDPRAYENVMAKYGYYRDHAGVWVKK